MSKVLLSIGYEYDCEVPCYHKLVTFDYNDINKGRRLADLLYMNKKLEVFYGDLYHLCNNKDELIKKETDLLMETLNIDNLEVIEYGGGAKNERK